MKKVICLVLSVVTAFSVLCINASAAETSNSMNVYGVYLSREGDCSLIESDGEWLIIDTGLEEVSNEFLQKLAFYGITEACVLISHLHSDHIGGFSALAESDIKINGVYLPDKTLTPYDEHTQSKQNKVINKAKENNEDVVITELEKGDTFSFGSVNAKVLGPVSSVTLDDFAGTDTQEAIEQYVNCRSLTVRFDCGEVSFITAGDIEKEEEKALVNEYKGTGELDADIMKLSHHALYTSNTEEFLAQITPKYSYALNSNKTINESSNYRMYYTSCKNASQYGPVYLVGEEKLDFKASASNGKIDIYKGANKLSGLVSLAGGDGTVVKTNMYYINGQEVKEGVYTVGGKKYYVFDGGLVNKAFYSFNLNRYVYRYEPVENGDVRYFDKNGVMYTGFHKLNDNYFYFDTNTGVMVKGDKNWTPVQIGNKKYAINENGAVYNYGKSSGAWKKYGSNYRYFDKKGVMLTGWQTIGGKKYYLDTKTGYRVTGFVKYNGEYYRVKNGLRASSKTYIKYNNVFLRLSTDQYKYNGKKKTPTVEVYDSKANKISSKNYTVEYKDGRKNVGKYKVTVKFKKNYSGSKKLYFTIKPDDTSISKITAYKKSLKVKFKKKTKQVTGYQIQYSTSKTFKSATTKTVSDSKKTSLTIKKLKAKKTYYVRIRTYKKADGKKYYSEWSKYKYKKTK
ncbi:MAG: MBL fold metallo-hydrolase [Clostridia bacterium]|nr:MBL fold metallo-hydrolase [Clostridia bacterium]